MQFLQLPGGKVSQRIGLQMAEHVLRRIELDDLIAFLAQIPVNQSRPRPRPTLITSEAGVPSGVALGDTKSKMKN